MRRVTSKLLPVLMLLTGLPSGALAIEYAVKASDSLSKISSRFLGTPVYGPSGTMSKILEINPSIINPDLIFTGDKIIIPDQESFRGKGNFGTETKTPEASCTVYEPHDREPALNTEGDQKNHDDSASHAEEPEFNRYSLLQFEPEFSFARIDGQASGNASTATFLSNLNLGGALSWMQVWSDQFRSYAKLHTQKIALQEASSRTLQNSSQFYSRLSIGGQQAVSQSTHLGLEIGYGQQIVYRSPSATAIAFDQVLALDTLASISQDLLRANPFLVGINIQGGVFFPSSTSTYKVNAGSQINGTIYIKQLDNKDPHAERLSLGIFYRITNSSTSLIKLQRRDLGLGLGYTWRFGK